MKIKDSNSLNTDIHWVCIDCGKRALSNAINIGKKQFSVSTYHNGTCDVCKELKSVTQTRDFGFPKFEVEDK
jgi:hypothetical protein